MEDGLTLASIVLSLSSDEVAADPAIGDVNSPKEARGDVADEPREFSELGLRAAEGVLRLPGPDHRLLAAFPALSASIGGAALSQLVALSRLVGMECPGLHSVFTGFDVEVADDGAPDRLSWRVVRTIPHLGAVRIRVSDGLLDGTVNAFVRPAPVNQPTTTELRHMVSRGEFEGVQALVVGGSRGLGELAAKVIAAGGGTPTVTWNTGQRDAQAVVDDITSAGGHAELMRLDVADPMAGLQVASGVGQVSHLLYFASPRITGRRIQPFDAEQFDRLTSAYVHGFLRTVTALHEVTSAPLHVFYPSTVYVDELPAGLIEYAAAKTVGELAARGAAVGYPWLSVDIQRLPRLHTDQTAGLAAGEIDDTPGVLLDALRRFL